MYSSILVGIIFLLIESICGTHAQDNRMFIGSSIGRIVGSILLILDLIAIFELLTSHDRGICSKLTWVLIIVLFPIGGLILYWCFARNRTVPEVL